MEFDTLRDGVGAVARDSRQACGNRLACDATTRQVARDRPLHDPIAVELMSACVDLRNHLRSACTLVVGQNLSPIRSDEDEILDVIAGDIRVEVRGLKAEDHARL